MKNIDTIVLVLGFGIAIIPQLFILSLLSGVSEGTSENHIFVYLQTLGHNGWFFLSVTIGGVFVLLSSMIVLINKIKKHSSLPAIVVVQFIVIGMMCLLSQIYFVGATAPK